MKAFIAGAAAAIVIAIVAGVILDTAQIDTAQNFASQNARLPGAN
jgi:hypothetical protein